MAVAGHSAVVVAALCTLALPVHAQLQPTFQEPCVRGGNFPPPNTRGPFDYRNQRYSLRGVEVRHFTPEVENLIRGTTGPLAGEFSFVLHAFPNHHRALAALSRWAVRDKTDLPTGLDYTVDCYFRRALVFRPDDSVVRLLYADHLSRQSKRDEASAQVDYVRAANPDNPLTQYNLGLLYFQLGRFEDALVQAHRAMDMGLPRTALRDKLQARGLWREPAAGTAASAPGGAASAATAPAATPEPAASR